MMLVKSLTDDLVLGGSAHAGEQLFPASILDRVIEFLPIEDRKMIRYRKMAYPK
jgi:hypothetical protein